MTDPSADSGCWDVAVVGGGLAALLAADRLADDARVVLVTGTDAPTPASARSLGIVAQGGQDSPARLALALGEEAARAFWHWSGEAVGRLLTRASELGAHSERCGSWRLSLGEREWGEWQSSAELIQRWSADESTVRVASEGELEGEGVGPGFDGGVHVPGDGVVDSLALHRALGATLQDRVRIVRDTATVFESLEGGSKRLALGSGETLDAEIVLVAAGWGSSQVAPWFREMLYPVRLQALRTGVLPEGSFPCPVLARQRFECWLQEPSGRLAFVGCRWAEQPEMEAGVTDDTTISHKVEAKQRDFLEQHLPGVLDAGVAEQWTGTAALSCDGLPLVGPLPGDPRVIALCGWGGWGLSLMAQAIDDVATMVLGRQDSVTPAFLSPRRML